VQVVEKGLAGLGDEVAGLAVDDEIFLLDPEGEARPLHRAPFPPAVQSWRGAGGGQSRPPRHASAGAGRGRMSPETTGCSRSAMD
jgi:hypothetical protein